MREMGPTDEAATENAAMDGHAAPAADPRAAGASTTCGVRVGVFGGGAAAAARRASLARVGAAVVWEGEDEDALGDLPASLGLLVVAGPVAGRSAAVVAAATRGVAAFVEWPPAPGLREAHALVRLGEETGTDVGVARTWRFAPTLAAWGLWPGVTHAPSPETGATPRAAPAPLVLVDATAPAPLLGGHVLADLVDLAACLTRGTSLRRLDARLVRDAARAPVALAASLRFTSGAYAQIVLTPAPGGTAPRRRIAAATPAGALDADLWPERAAALDAETRAVLAAAATGAPPPVSALDALALVRLLDRVTARLR